MSSQHNILQELTRRKENEKCRFFIPNGKQAELIGKIANNGHNIYVFSAANGVGKTAVTINILANFIFGPQNKYFDHEIFRNFPYPKKIRIGTNPNNVEETGAIDTEITTWWPRDRYERFKQGHTYYSLYKANGWLIEKLSYEQDTKDWESSTLGIAMFDEPPPKDKFIATVSRMRKGGIIIFAMTPLFDAGWILDDIINSSDKDIYTIYADVEANCKEHGERGQLEHKHIEAMVSKMPPEERMARAEGKFMHMSSVILAGIFIPEYHIIKNEIQAPSGAQWGMCLDPASGKPWAMCWYWVDHRGQVVIDREYPLDDFTKCGESKLDIYSYAKIIKQLDSGCDVRTRIIDRHYANNTNNKGTTLKRDMYDECGIDFKNSYKVGNNEIEQGIQKVKDYLRFDRTKPLSNTNFPKLLVKERCKNVIKALERWQRDKQPPYRPDERSPYKDHFDIVRYIVKEEPQVEYNVTLLPREPKYIMGGR